MEAGQLYGSKFMINQGTILQARYRIVRLIAQGGMGAVYEAVDQRIDKRVALKQSLLNSPEAGRYFEREAKLMAKLDHRNLPQVSDHFIEAGGHFLVMEFVDGDDLEEIAHRQQHSFTLDEVRHIATQLLDALQYMHTREIPIIHRDIKPNNIKRTPQGTIKLIDFGLAKGTAGASSLVGYTPAYAPLEQLQQEGSDARSDLYSLGATLYRLLTGEMPVTALNRLKEIAKHRPDPLRSVHHVNPAVPEAIGQVVAKAMEVDRDDRYASAAEMKQALDAAFASGGTTAPAADVPAYEKTVLAKGGAGYEPTFVNLPVGKPSPTINVPDAPKGKSTPSPTRVVPPIKPPESAPAPPRLPNPVPALLSDKPAASKKGLWIACAVVIALVTFAIVFFTRDSTNRPSEGQQSAKLLATESKPAAVKEEVLRYWLSVKDKPEEKLREVPNNVGFVPQFTAKQGGFLYIIAPNQNKAPTVVLARSVNSKQFDNVMTAGSVYSLYPLNTKEKAFLTVVFSPTKETNPVFLDGKQGQTLSASEQIQWEEYRKKYADSTPEPAPNENAFVIRAASGERTPAIFRVIVGK